MYFGEILMSQIPSIISPWLLHNSQYLWNHNN